MPDFNYTVHLTLAVRGRPQELALDLVERARMQAGGREPIFGGRTASDDDSRPEPAVLVAFGLLATDDDELVRVVGVMLEWLEDHEQTPVLAFRVASRKEEPPMTVDGRGSPSTPRPTSLPSAPRRTASS